jgi:hypothetical protein
MKIVLAALLAAVLVSPCLAKDDNAGEDKTSGDVLTPGVDEPRTPDTLKPNADQRIRTEGLNSERQQERVPPAERPAPDESKSKK